MTANGMPVRKPSDLVETDAAIVAVPAYDYVGRGALKLAFGLEHWQIDLMGRVVLDIGASTGGFTEVCLRGGAITVYAVDVGQGQLHPRIAADARVVSLEKTDARTLDRTLIPREVDVVVCDVSFVSLTKVLSRALDLAQAGADLIALVKPQFEAGRAAVGKGGIVTNDGARADAGSACVYDLSRATPTVPVVLTPAEAAEMVDEPDLKALLAAFKG